MMELGDYGSGLNRTLPVEMSVCNFLRIRTWMGVNDKKMAQKMVKDSTTSGAGRVWKQCLGMSVSYIL